MKEFENDYYLRNKFITLVHDAGIKTVIETGTEYGGTANSFAYMKPVLSVITIDIDTRWTDPLHPNVYFVQGNSIEKLPHALDVLSKQKLFPVLFFLDAHPSICGAFGPLADELKIIGAFWKEHADFPLPWITIHDCYSPNKQFGFDTYHDGPISWDTHKANIMAIYPKGCTVTYNEEAVGAFRGCLFVEPAKS